MTRLRRLNYAMLYDLEKNALDLNTKYQTEDNFSCFIVALPHSFSANFFHSTSSDQNENAIKFWSLFQSSLVSLISKGFE